MSICLLSASGASYVSCVCHQREGGLHLDGVNDLEGVEDAALFEGEREEVPDGVGGEGGGEDGKADDLTPLPQKKWHPHTVKVRCVRQASVISVLGLSHVDHSDQTVLRDACGPLLAPTFVTYSCVGLVAYALEQESSNRANRGWADPLPAACHKYSEDRTVKLLYTSNGVCKASDIVIPCCR